MSGAYQHGSYEIFAPQSTKGKYNKYANQIVAIVSVTEDKKGGIKSARLYLTEEVEKVMDRCNFIKLGMSGSNVGVIPMQENDGECYVVNRKRAEDAEQRGMAFVNITAFAKYAHLEDGVYNAHKEPGGVIEFNIRSKPSRA